MLSSRRLARARWVQKTIGVLAAEYLRFVNLTSRTVTVPGDIYERAGADLPVIIHTRDADDDTAAILDAEMAKGRFKGLLHCFSSGHALAEIAVKHDMMVSFSGILTFNKARGVQESAQALPMQNLLVETDAPYLAPVPLRGKRNEPSFVAHTAAFLAKLKGVSVAEITETTTANFLRLFDKVPHAAVSDRRAA